MPNAFARRDILLGAGGLMLAGAASALRAAAPAPDLVGFVSGINAYREIRPLKRAVADAKSIAGTIGGFGYDVVLAENVGTEAFLNRFATFLDKVGPNSSTFLYLACHGIQVMGRNFILPADVKGSDGDAMLEGSIQTDQLLRDLAARNPRQCIVLFDACREEPVDVSVPGRAEGFTSTNSPGGFYVAYSAGAGQLAIDNLGDDDKDPNGLFVRCLLREMAPDLSIDDIVKATRETVAVTAQTVGRNQNPAIYDQARRDLRLDGAVMAPKRRPAATHGRIDGAGILIVALQQYDRYSKLGPLTTPYSDARRLADDFRRIGAEATILLEPSREELLKAGREFGAKGYRKRFLYLSGSGSLADHDGWMNVPLQPTGKRQDKPRPVTTTRGISVASDTPDSNFFGDISRISTTEIFTAMAEGADAASKAAPKVGVRGLLRKSRAGYPAKALRDTHMFCDFCLSEGGSIIPVDPSASKSGWSILQELHGEVLIGAQEEHPAPGNFPGCSILFASSFFQEALDAAPGHSSSPFAIALGNALGQPGLSVVQFADRVRSEVEVLTGRMQSPMLACEPATYDRVMIDPA